MATATDDESSIKDQKSADDRLKYWIDEIASARKREKSYRKDATRCVEIYEANVPGSPDDSTNKSRLVAYNILYSNTDTLLPALYNTTPRPVVQRRYKDEDPLGKAASTLMQRTLQFCIDDGEQEYSPFDDLMRAGVLEGLVPGRGVTRFKFDAKIEKDASGKEVAAKYQKVCGEEVPWNRFLHGYGKKWNQVPWIAYEHHFTKDEFKENFPEYPMSDINFEKAEIEVDGDGEKLDSGDEASEVRMIVVQEIWSKTNKKVYFISDCCTRIIKEVDDPLELSGFFPSPKPMGFVAKISSLTPTPLYKMYEDQARELNLITVRLNRLIAACRVRGVFDSQVKGLDDALKAEDNVMIPADNVAAQGNIGGSLEKALWLFPIDKVIQVIQQLYLARQQVKAVIFEITGIADIMRGSSQASETLGAQEIKNQWGTLRLKKGQKEVMRYVRDCLRIMGEIAVTKIPAPVLKAMTGLPLPMAAEKQQAELKMQQMQQEAMIMAQQAAAQGQQPPQPPAPPPELQQILSSPTMEEVLAVLQNDLTRAFKIDIETNSTVDAEATEDKQNISELLNAMAQFLNGVAPLIEQGILPFEAAKTMLLTITRRFRFGDDVEDALKMMKQPEPKADPKAEAEKTKLQMEQQKFQQEQAAAQQQQGFDMEMKKMDIALASQKNQMEMAKLKMEAEFAQAEHAMKMAELQMKAAVQKASAETSLMQTAVTAQTQAQAGQIKLRQQSEGAQIKDKQMRDQASLREKQMKQAAQQKPAPKKD